MNKVKNIISLCFCACLILFVFICVGCNNACNNNESENKIVSYNYITNRKVRISSGVGYAGEHNSYYFHINIFNQSEEVVDIYKANFTVEVTYKFPDKNPIVYEGAVKEIYKVYFNNNYSGEMDEVIKIPQNSNCNLYISKDYYERHGITQSDTTTYYEIYSITLKYNGDAIKSIFVSQV